MLIPSHLFDRYENFKPNLKILRERVNRHDERFTVRGKQKGEVISTRRLMNVAWLHHSVLRIQIISIIENIARTTSFLLRLTRLETRFFRQKEAIFQRRILSDGIINKRFLLTHPYEEEGKFLISLLCQAEISENIFDEDKFDDNRVSQRVAAVSLRSIPAVMENSLSLPFSFLAKVRQVFRMFSAALHSIIHSINGF